MPPQSPPNNPAPQSPPPQSPPPAKPANSAQLIRWGWFLTLAIPAAIVGYAVIEFIVNATNAEGGSLQRVANILVFLIGAAGVFGFPAGIVMLIVGYSNRKKAAPPPK